LHHVEVRQVGVEGIRAAEGNPHSAEHGYTSKRLGHPFPPPSLFRRRAVLLAGFGRSLCRLVMQRPAAEWREPSAENDARIDQIGARNHAFVAAALTFCNQWSHQLAAKALQFGLVIGLVRFLRLAVLPHVEAFAGFLAELALTHHPVELSAARMV